MDETKFTDIIWQKGRELYRDMPWRQDTRPYYVLVSELMLQQTQVSRVIPKFEAFIQAFPDEKVLSSASLADVLRLWQGLGYNRRAKYLHEAAKMIVARGEFPDTYEGLIKLSGVGKNTAGAILAYSYNHPSIFIETNIRTVYLHYFFQDGEVVDDRQLLELLAETIDKISPREWYWALMDYGSWLKKQGMGRLAQSRQYKKQAPLKGSVREVRGRIIKALSYKDMSRSVLREAVLADDRFDVALNGLLQDGLVSEGQLKFHLTK